jgi:hypothetical protein
MKITARKANKKRHTLGYKIGGKWHTRKQAVELAQGGKIVDVYVCKGRYGKYIQSNNILIKYLKSTEE